MFLLFFRHDFCWVIDIIAQYDVLAAKKVHSCQKSRLVENRLNWPNYRYFVLISQNAKMSFAALTSAKCALVPVSVKTWMQLYGCVSYKLTIWKFWEIPRKSLWRRAFIKFFTSGIHLSNKLNLPGNRWEFSKNFWTDLLINTHQLLFEKTVSQKDSYPNIDVFDRLGLNWLRFILAMVEWLTVSCISIYYYYHGDNTVSCRNSLFCGLAYC